MESRVFDALHGGDGGLVVVFSVRIGLVNGIESRDADEWKWIASWKRCFDFLSAL